MNTEMKCPVCGEQMEVRTEEILSDSFVSGKETIVVGWDCECDMSLDLYER